jgi:hypothetical protein
MSMKSSSSAKSRTTPAASKTARKAAASETVDAARQQAVVASEAAETLRRGFEAMRKIQEQAMRDTLERHALAARKLRAGSTPADLIGVQGELLRADMEAVVRYMQDLSAASLEMEAELLGCTTHLVDTDSVLEGFAMLKSLPLAAPVIETFFQGAVPPADQGGKGYQPRAEAS